MYPGFGASDHTRVAIQLLSVEPPRRRTYLHTGWVEVAPDQWVYLHASGTVGAGDIPDVLVRMEGALAHYSLPEVAADQRVAVRASLRLLELAPDPISFPVYSAIWRAALATADFSIFIAGQTGVYKSELSALAQQHFGTGMDARHLPGSWTSTDNALEGLCFLAKDALLVIDDFSPNGGHNNVQRLHSKADRVLRGQGRSLSSPFDVSDYKRFEQTQLPAEVAKCTPGEWNWGNRKLSAVQMEPEHTWVDFTRWFRRNETGNFGTQPDRCAACAKTVITSHEERRVTLRLGFDDWMKIWLNGQPVTTLRHDNGFEVSEVPVTLNKGDNSLVVSLSNFDNVEWRCWAFSCVIDKAEHHAAADTQYRTAELTVRLHDRES